MGFNINSQPMQDPGRGQNTKISRKKELSTEEKLELTTQRLITQNNKIHALEEKMKRMENKQTEVLVALNKKSQQEAIENVERVKIAENPLKNLENKIMSCDIEQNSVQNRNYITFKLTDCKKFVSLHKEVSSWKNVEGHDCPICCYPLEKYGDHYKFGCCMAEAHKGECEQ